MADEDKNDHLKLVSDNDEKELQRQREKARAQHTAGELNAALRSLAANILRIMAGAGKSYALIGEIVDVLEAYDRLGSFPDHAHPHTVRTAMEEALRDRDWRRRTDGYSRPTEDDLARCERDGSMAVKDAKASIVQAALRLVAAELTAQPTHERAANHQFMDAIRHLREAQQHRREQLASPTRHKTNRPNEAKPWDEVVGAQASASTKKIGLYDALDEQNRKRRQSDKPTTK
jgi:hypothetical protein